MRPLLFINPAALARRLCQSAAGAGTPDARVRHWIEALRQPDSKIRKEAAFKLGNLGLTDPPIGGSRI